MTEQLAEPGLAPTRHRPGIKRSAWVPIQPMPGENGNRANLGIGVDPAKQKIQP